MPALVAAWTAVAGCLALVVTGLLTTLVWGEVRASYLMVSAIVASIVTAPIAYQVVKLMHDLNRSRTALQRLAQLDSLTGLANRGHFFQRTEQLLRVDVAPVWPLSALMIDVDHFKTINDDAGHAAGDAVISEVARILERNLRGEDFVARYGGEEFAAILPQTDRITAMTVAERMCIAVADDAALRKFARRAVTISVGVATTPEAVPVDALLLAADRALYSAKAGGRNRAAYLDIAAASGTSARVRALPAKANAGGSSS